MKLTDKKLLIFDLDGTLIDSVPDLALALNLMLQALSRNTFSEDIIRTWVGNGAQILVKRALSGANDIDETIDVALFEKALSLFLEFYKENLTKKTSLYEGVAQTIQELHKRDYILSIVTNKPYAFVPPLLEHLQLEKYFQHILGGDSLDLKKPHPQPLLHTCKYFQIPKEQTLMIGDSKNDIIAANKANIESVALTYGYNYTEPIHTHNPTIVIDTFKELTKILD